MSAVPQPDKRPWRGWYKLARWQQLREWQLDRQPLCSTCLLQEIVEPATVVDHVTPHKGNPDLFWDADNLQSLCKTHHDREKQLEELGRKVILFDANGWPI